jgi:hypothetical protein
MFGKSFLEALSRCELLYLSELVLLPLFCCYLELGAEEWRDHPLVMSLAHVVPRMMDSVGSAAYVSSHRNPPEMLILLVKFP